MSTPSIRRTLLLRCGLGTAFLMCLLSATVYLLVRQSLYRVLDESIEQMAALLANEIELENDDITFEWQEGIGTNRELIDRGLFQFWNEKTGVTTRSPALHFRNLPKFHGIDGKPLLRTIVLPDGNRGRAIGLRVYPFLLPDEAAAMRGRGSKIDPKSLPHTLVVARDAQPVERSLRRLRWVLAGGTLATLCLGLLIIERIIRTSLRPIGDLTAQVRDRAEHQLDRALDVPGALPVELTGLAANFDRLLARVASIRQRERDFIRHAAHELRTPIAGLQATTELALSQPREAAAYAAQLAACRETAEELAELVKRLSALARIGQTAAAQPVPCDVAEVFRAALERFRPALDARGLTVAGALPALPVRADPALLRIIFHNLLDNAAAYATPGSELKLAGAMSGAGVVVCLSNRTDDPPEDPGRLFEPLFRRDSSRVDARSHLGIGLTLSLEAALAMGGNLAASCPQPGWIAFTFTLGSPGSHDVPARNGA